MAVTKEEGKIRLLNIVETVFDYGKHYEDSKHKSEICRAAVVRGRQCKYLDNCDFAHEIRQLCPRVFDLSNFKQQGCINWGAGCQYGVRCLYLHDEKVYELCPVTTLLYSRSERKFRIVRDQGDGTVCVHTIPTDCAAKRKLGRGLMKGLWSFVKEQYHKIKIPEGNSNGCSKARPEKKRSAKAENRPMQCCTVIPIKNTKAESPPKKEKCPEQVITDLLQMALTKDKKNIPMSDVDRNIQDASNYPEVSSAPEMQKLPEQPYTFSKGSFAAVTQPRDPPPGFGKPAQAPTNQIVLPPPFVPGQQWLPTQNSQAAYIPEASPPYTYENSTYSQGNCVYSLSWSPSCYDTREDMCNALPCSYTDYSPPYNENCYYPPNSQYHSNWWNSHHETSNTSYADMNEKFTNGVMLPPSREPSPSRSRDKEAWVDDDHVEKKEQSVSPRVGKSREDAFLNDIPVKDRKDPVELMKVLRKYAVEIEEKKQTIKKLMDDRQCARLAGDCKSSCKSMPQETHVSTRI